MAGRRGPGTEGRPRPPPWRSNQNGSFAADRTDWNRSISRVALPPAAACRGGDNLIAAGWYAEPSQYGANIHPHEAAQTPLPESRRESKAIRPRRPIGLHPHGGQTAEQKPKQKSYHRQHPIHPSIRSPTSYGCCCQVSQCLNSDPLVISLKIVPGLTSQAKPRHSLPTCSKLTDIRLATLYTNKS